MSGISLNLNEKGFRIAFTVESYLSPKKQKRDPNYVKYLFRLFGKQNGQYFERILDYHNCTEDDYAEFYPVKKQSSKALSDIKADPDRGFMCLDWKDDDPFELVGTSIDKDYIRLEVNLLPCNYVHT